MEYSPSQFTNLCVVAGYYKSLKSKDNRNYSSLYNNIFNDYRQEEMRLIEFDVSNSSEKVKVGGSLEMWSTFLTNTEVYGIYEDVEKMYYTEKIKSIVCGNMTDKGIQEFWLNPELQENFDVIIDGNEKKIDEKILFFKNSIHKVVPHGFYFMENIRGEDGEKMCREISCWTEQYPELSFFYEVVENPLQKTYNPILIVQRNS